MRDVAIVGAAMSDLTQYVDKNSFDLARETIHAAIADAGIERGQVDGIMITPPGLAGQSTAMFVSRLGEHLGIDLNALTCSENGGCSAALALRSAINEVASGNCDFAVACGIDQRYKEMPSAGEPFESFTERTVHNTMAVYGAYDGVYGLGAPIPYYAMAAQRYMHETGATPEDLAWAAVRLREHANKNPKAMFYEKKLTVEDVLGAKYLAPPLHLTDCSQFVSGAGAVVVTSVDTAKKRGKPFAKLRAWGQAHHPSAFSNSAASITKYPAVERAAGKAFELAGLKPQDIDVAEVYGVFSSTELLLCEGIGFCARGKAGKDFQSGRLTYGGDIVVDPSGGRLSLGHPACATPLLETFEIYKQLVGAADARQVKDAQLGLVHAEHGMLNGAAIAIWERSDA